MLILKPVGDALKEWQKILLVERVQTLLFSIELKYSLEKQQYKMVNKTLNFFGILSDWQDASSLRQKKTQNNFNSFNFNLFFSNGNGINF